VRWFWRIAAIVRSIERYNAVYAPLTKLRRVNDSLGAKFLTILATELKRAIERPGGEWTTLPIRICVI